MAAWDESAELTTRRSSSASIKYWTRIFYMIPRGLEKAPDPMHILGALSEVVLGSEASKLASEKNDSHAHLLPS